MKPRISALDRRTAMRLAATEYQCCAELLRSLDSLAWAAPTACPAWDVRQMAAHMLGMVEMAASIREGSRQRRAATVNGNIDIDRLTALQVSERSGWSGPAITGELVLAALGDRGADRWIRWTTIGLGVAALTPLSVDGMIVAASTTLLADSRSGRNGGALASSPPVIASAVTRTSPRSDPPYIANPQAAPDRASYRPLAAGPDLQRNYSSPWRRCAGCPSRPVATSEADRIRRRRSAR